jgi:hypothetical protein
MSIAYIAPRQLQALLSLRLVEEMISDHSQLTAGPRRPIGNYTRLGREDGAGLPKGCMRRREPQPAQ